MCAASMGHWYYMHEKLVKGLGHAREKYGELLVQWGVSCSMLALSREHTISRRGGDRWWTATYLNRKWAHLCKLAGKARGAWEQEQEQERERGQEWEQELRRRRVEAFEGWEETGQEGWYHMIYGWRKSGFYAPTHGLKAGVQEGWAIWPVGSAVCNSAMMEAAQGAASNATAVGVVGSNLLGQLNWAPKHVTCPDNVLSKCVTIQI